MKVKDLQKELEQLDPEMRVVTPWFSVLNGESKNGFSDVSKVAEEYDRNEKVYVIS